MWGKIEAGNIIKIYAHPVTLVDAQGTVHPKSYFTDNNKLATFGVYPVTPVGGSPTHKNLYYYGGINYVWNSTDSVIEATESFVAYALEDVNVVWTQAEVDDGYAPDGTSADDARNDEDGNQIVTLGLRSKLKNQVRTQQSSLLATTDKWIVRKSEKGTAIPTTVTTYRDGIRSAATTMETSITDAADFVAISVLFDATYDSDNVMTAPAPLYNFPSKPNGMPE
jgi:hypothetical protein|tara:strand:- start:369 stop:1040 length:672 start_codon:yes stop_codon:yes gene_type:complete